MSIWQRLAVPWWPNPTICISNKPPVITTPLNCTFLPTGITPKPPAPGPYTITHSMRIDDDSRPPTTLFTLAWSADFPSSIGQVTNHQNATGTAGVAAIDLVPYVTASVTGSVAGRCWSDLLSLLRQRGLI